MVELVRQNLRENKKIYNNVVRGLRKVIAKNVPIDHVGSTAIPNMYGKNIIDILIGAKDLKEIDKLTDIISSSGFYGSKKNKDDIYRFFASTEEETKSGDIHIHLVILDTDRYKDFITLRDYLLNNKEEVKEYSKFKKELLKKGYEDRKDYKKIKSEYVSNLIIRAKKSKEKQ